MKLMVASYNNGIVDWNAEAEETNLLSYKVDHSFNGPAVATIVLSDPTGSVSQKYDVTANDVYVGVAKVTIEDPNGTDVFFGRLVSARHDSASHRVTLTARDWLDQLNDEVADYDMREDLGAGLRQSEACSDPDNATYVGPAYNDGAGGYYFYDDDMSWSVDQFNGMNLMFTAGMAGDISLSTGPYAVTYTEHNDGMDFPGDFHSAWYNDGAVDSCADNDSDYEIAYDFRVLVNASNFFSADSITAIKVHAVYQLTNADAAGLNQIFIWDHTAGVKVLLGNLEINAVDNRNVTFTVPSYFSDRVLDASGIAHVIIEIDQTGVALATLVIDELRVEVDCSTTGYSSSVSITDTERKLDGQPRLKVGTDLTAAATKIWEGIPYSICEHIHTHINGLVTAGDAQVTLTTSIEDTTGVSLSHFEKKSRLEMMRELATEDAAVFWLILGGTEVQWKQTTDAVHADLTDSDVIKWMPEGYDFEKMKNAYTVYGITVAGAKVAGTHSDATSIAKFKTTRSEVVSSRSLSDADATNMATALTHKNCDILYFLKAVLAGLSTIRLGDYIEVTSTWLSLTDAAYTVTGWEYDSSSYRTTVTLEPRNTVGYNDTPTGIEGFRKAMQKAKAEQSDRYYSDLQTQTWT